MIECVCEDERLHRERVENRKHDIPGWYELTWDQANGSRVRYSPLSFERKLVLSAQAPIEENLAKARTHLGMNA